MIRIKTSPQRLLVLTVLTLALAGCGPQFSLISGFKAITSDVVLGGGRKPAPPPQLPVLNAVQPPILPLPGLIPPAPHGVALPSPPPPPSCPVADPFAIPALPAINVASSAPSKGAPYPYRYSGKRKVGDTETVLPLTGTRQVTEAGPASVPGSSDAFQFTYVENYNGVAISTTYTVLPSDPASNNPASQSTIAGIYLSEASSADGKYAFKPQAPGLQEMPFPALTSKGFGGTASDPTLRESETLQPDQYVSNPFGYLPGPAGSDVHEVGTRILKKDRVDACGVVVDAWQVELIGTFTAPNTQLSFDNLVDFATQYGGLPIWEHLRETGTQVDPATGQSQAIMLDETATISQVPRKS